MLESTIAHELMHSVMQYTLTDGMFGRGGDDEYPEWFVEGTAQLAGGGFPTNWNNRLHQIAAELGGNASTNIKDGAIKDYLKSYELGDRPYGHGYLAAAYIGYLVSFEQGGFLVESQTIARGMDKIFADLLNGKPLNQALNNQTNGKIRNQSDVEDLFRYPDADFVMFVRQLSCNSMYGAGSVITPNLNDGGDGIIGSNSSLPDQALYVNNTVFEASGKMQLMIGYDNTMDIPLFRLDSMGLRLTSTNLSTQASANKAIASIDSSINQVSVMRSHYGAAQNRLEHTINNLNITVENLTAAESRIRDTDMAMALTEYTRNQILLQSGQAMLAQANQTPGGVLSLLSA